jgi:hypothetical protein
MKKGFLLFIVFVLGMSANAQKQKVRNDSLTLQNILNEVTLIKKKMTPDSLPGMPMITDSLPKVINIGIVGGSRSLNTADFGDHISIKLTDLNKFITFQNSFRKKGVNDSLSEMILYINGNPMRDIGVASVNSNENSLIFHLDRHSLWLAKFYPYFPFLWSKIHVYVSVGFRNGVFLGTEGKANKFHLQYIDNWAWLFTFLLIVSIIVSFLVLAIRTNLIRIGDDQSPFSLSLTQLAFWTIIISASFVYIWVITGELTPITGSTLVLLSISMATTGGSRLVDIRRDPKTPENIPPSGGFIKDVLSDSLGYSVHRSQMFLWTIILGIIFISAVVVTQKMPQLDSTLLGLMGISSSAYVGLKMIENKPGEEELPDKAKKDSKEGLRIPDAG